MGTLTLDGVRKFFGALEVIKGVDLAIADRELVVFVGPSGCGKSTLLRMIAGLEDVDYGAIAIDGADVTETAPARRGVAMVFQNYALYPHMSAYDNMAYGLRRAGLPRDQVDRRVRQAADILQIEHLLPRRPKAMSGGQRQRVAIGRAIVREPKIFLFDEPLSNLDAALRVEMRAQITRLHRELAATMIFVTHDQVEAMTLADRIVVMRAGMVEQVGTPMEVYRNPRNIFVASFIGSPSINLLKGSVHAGDAGGIYLRLAGIEEPLRIEGQFAQATVGDLCTLGVRPERLKLVDGTVNAMLNGFQVTQLERLGGESIIRVSRQGMPDLTLKSAGDIRLALGDVVTLDMDVADAVLFDSSGETMRAPE